MFLKNWKKEICTVPNFLSLLRILLIPIYVSVYQNAKQDQQYMFAGLLIILSCITDLLDGIIARRCHMISNVGKLLDPLADKLTQLSLMLCLANRYSAMYALVSLFLIKEILQLVFFLTHFRKKLVLPGALMAGKVCTAVLFGSLIALVLFPDMHRYAVAALILTDLGCLLYSFSSYLAAYYGVHPKTQHWGAE